MKSIEQHKRFMYSEQFYAKFAVHVNILIDCLPMIYGRLKPIYCLIKFVNHQNDFVLNIHEIHRAQHADNW